jgi:hypothetical protein
MLILLVNAFENSPRGSKDYLFFKCLLSATLLNLGQKGTFVERQVNRLGDYAVNWEHDGLDETAKVYVSVCVCIRVCVCVCVCVCITIIDTIIHHIHHVHHILTNYIY